MLSAVVQPPGKEEIEGSFKPPPKGNSADWAPHFREEGRRPGKPLAQQDQPQGGATVLLLQGMEHIAAFCPNKTSTGVKAKRKPLFNQSGEEQQKPVIFYPTASVALEIDGWSKELSAAVVPKLPVDVLISWTDYMSVDRHWGPPVGRL